MKKWFVSIIILAVVFVTLQAANSSAETSHVSWSGFFDAQHIIYDDPTQIDGFHWGQFELDLEAELSEIVAIEGAVAYDPATGTFGLGAGLLNLRLTDNLELGIGQFDVPVGIDLNYYPSPDRSLVSTPLLNGKMYASWNDLGLRLSSEYGIVNGVVYVVNGAALAADQGMAQATGGRVGVKIGEGEIGISVANDPTATDVFLGGDFTYSLGSWDFVAEYMNVTNAGSNKASAYYGQAKYDFGRAFLVGRYGAYNEEGGYDRDVDTYGSLSRISIGAGLKVDEKSEIRIEYQQNSEEGDPSKVKDNVTYLQAVVSF